MGDLRHRILDSVLAGAFVPVSLRVRLMRRLGYRLGRGVEIYSGAHLGSTRIRFGDRVFVNNGLYYDGNADVRVGDHVAFGPHVRLITATHEIGRSSGRRCTSSAIERPIDIDDGCWLAAGVTVLPGVRISKGCVIGAGAVVSSSTEPDGLYLGVPARRVRDLPVAAGAGRVSREA